MFRTDVGLKDPTLMGHNRIHKRKHSWYFCSFIVLSISLYQHLIKHRWTLGFYTSTYCFTVSSLTFKDVFKWMRTAHVFCRTCYYCFISHQFIVSCAGTSFSDHDTSFNQDHIYILYTIFLSLGYSIKLNILFYSAPDKIGNTVEVNLFSEKDYYRQHLYIHGSLKLIISDHEVLESLNGKAKQTDNRCCSSRVANFFTMWSI